MEQRGDTAASIRFFRRISGVLPILPPRIFNSDMFSTIISSAYRRVHVPCLFSATPLKLFLRRLYLVVIFVVSDRRRVTARAVVPVVPLRRVSRVWFGFSETESGMKKKIKRGMAGVGRGVLLGVL